MERTGLNATVLLRLLNARGCPMSKGTLSSIVSKSRRCGLTKAIVLNEITGVPVKNLIQWPPRMGDATGDETPNPGRNNRTNQAHT
jgi:hypothetical protein